MTPDSARGQRADQAACRAHVAVTSTLPVFEQTVPPRAAQPSRDGGADSAGARGLSLSSQYAPPAAGTASRQAFEGLPERVALEHKFVKSGGLLLAGPDPDRQRRNYPRLRRPARESSFWSSAGFTPVDAIRIATLNGATFMGLADRIGSIAAGKDADLVLIKGNPAADIADIEKVDTVFKDGVGYDSAKLLESVKGRYGRY